MSFYSECKLLVSTVNRVPINNLLRASDTEEQKTDQYNTAYFYLQLKYQTIRKFFFNLFFCFVPFFLFVFFSLFPVVTTVDHHISRSFGTCTMSGGGKKRFSVLLRDTMVHDRAGDRSSNLLVGGRDIFVIT